MALSHLKPQILSPHSSQVTTQIPKFLLSCFTVYKVPLDVDVLQFVFLDGNRNTIPSLAFLNNAITGTIKILRSCNRLLLWFIKDHSVVRYYICNPTTRQYTMLPNPSTRINMTIVGMSLAFDPLKSDQYKAVCIWQSNLPEPVVELLPFPQLIEVYSPSSGSWRAVPVTDIFSAPLLSRFDHGVYWNGAIHWVSPDNAALHFDVEQESLKTMALPPWREIYSSDRFQYFGVCHGHLHIIEILMLSTPCFSVLEMAKDYSGWFLKYHVHLSDLGSQFPDMVRRSNQSTSYTYKVPSVVRGEKKKI